MAARSRRALFPLRDSRANWLNLIVMAHESGNLMLHIVLDQQQSDLLKQSGRTLQVFDPRGRLIGFIEPAPSEAEIARAKARMAIDEPEYTTDEVLEHLRSLEKR